ncbi:hypothetical protein FKV24_014620 [Lysobacter maris]|uniref:Uncharacterized protein n=1 Tax=Marilutibacter maris TaxID=1605891 RepID=A0A508A5Y2_9GAMM|nr:hypothetical protein [Lysobacter maris]KAB8172517.1 hypothetical protein FKV24_014620 [Lysobacter maris]
MKQMELRTLLLATGLLMSPLCHAQWLGDESTIEIEYASPEEALKVLLNQRGAFVRQSHGWISISERDGLSSWSITTHLNPAHPTIIKTRPYMSSTGHKLGVSMLCGANVETCNEVATRFRVHRDRIRRMPQWPHDEAEAGNGS